MSETAVERRLRDVCRWVAEEGGMDADADSGAIDSTWGVCRKVIASIRMDRERKRERSENP